MNRRAFIAKAGAIIAMPAIAPALAGNNEGRDPGYARVRAVDFNGNQWACSFDVHFADGRTETRTAQLINGAFRINCS
jgi:hypothetical protein